MRTDSITIPLTKVCKLEKRLGSRVWDGVVYGGESITNPTLTILHNKAGKAIRDALRLEEIENCSHAPCVCGQVRQFTLSRTKAERAARHFRDMAPRGIDCSAKGQRAAQLPSNLNQWLKDKRAREPHLEKAEQQ